MIIQVSGGYKNVTLGESLASPMILLVSDDVDGADTVEVEFKGNDTNTFVVPVEYIRKSFPLVTKVIALNGSITTSNLLLGKL